MNSLDTPLKIQQFLDSVRYAGEERNRSPLNVLRERQAHCLDGGIFGATAMRRIGYPPLLIDLLPEPGADDDHILVIYRVGNGWGALAKSNYVGLRWREPVYRNLRELFMSYFETFFNVNGTRTLRRITRPVNLARFDAWEWEWSDAGGDKIEKYFKSLRGRAIFTAEQVAAFTPGDEASLKAGLLIANPAGLYQPKI